MAVAGLVGEPGVRGAALPAVDAAVDDVGDFVEVDGAGDGDDGAAADVLGVVGGDDLVAGDVGDGFDGAGDVAAVGLGRAR